LGVSSLFFVNCNRSQLQLNSAKADSNVVNKIKSEPVSWQEISLPISAQTLVLHNGQIILASDEGLVSLTPSEAPKKFPPLKIQNEYVSTDGGLSRKSTEPIKQYPGDEKSYPYVCSPENAGFLSNDLYVFAICEHTAQLWKVTFGQKNTLLNLTDFTYHDIKSGDDSVLGPTRLSASDKTIFLPSFVEKGPALLTEDPKTGNLKVIWQGKDEDGGIASVYFIGEQGWMLLSGGKLFRSSDEGKNWQYFSNIPSKAEYNVVGLKFRNAQEGYIVGLEGQILSTVDGGKTWNFQNTGIDASLYKIAIDENTVAASGSYGSLLINRKGEDKWTKIEAKPDGDVRDLLIYDKKLYVLIEGKLYFTNLQ